MSAAENLNPYLSDPAVMFIKLHDLHWNVKGMQFVAVHLYTGSSYDDMAEKFDAAAGLIIMQGEKPVSAIGEFLKLASVKERGGRNYKDSEVIKIVTDDLALLRAEADKIHACIKNAI